MTAPIIQPDQWLHEHRQNPTGNDPVEPDKIVNRDQRLSLTIGGLSCREEIASRILAGILTREPGWSSSISQTVSTALEYTDALLAKTRKKAEGEA